MENEKEKKINEHEPRHRRAYAAIYDALTADSIDELSKMICDRYPQVNTATHQRRCPWKEDGFCVDTKCDTVQCDTAQDVLILGLRKFL